MISPKSNTCLAVVNSPELSENSSQTIANYRVEGSATSKTDLWFAISKEYTHWISHRLDGALLSLLIPAMRHNVNLHLDGVVTDTLLFSVNRDIQSVLQTADPSLNQISVSANETQSADEPSPHVAAGFSGGIDSFTTIGDYFLFGDIPVELRLSHLLYFNVGSHGSGGERLFRERWERILPTSVRLGLPFIRVNSNIDEWYGKSDDFPRTHVLRNVAASMVLQRGMGRYLHTSAYGWTSFGVGPDPFYSSRAEPMLAPLFTTGALTIQTVGSSRSRLERVKFVSGIRESFDSLDVCVSPIAAGNCSKCSKCNRTMLEMDLQGVLELYRGVFDLEYFRSQRNAIIAGIWMGSRPHDLEIQSLVRQLRMQPTYIEVGQQRLLSRARQIKHLIFR